MKPGVSERNRVQGDLEPVPGPPRRLLWGLLVRRERWSLSAGGKLLVVLAFSAAVCGFVHGIHSLLTVNDGGAGEVMVVEGWIGSRPIDQAARAFEKGHYQCVVVVKGIYEAGDRWTSPAQRQVQAGAPKTKFLSVMSSIS